MPAPGLTFATGPGLVACDPSGRVVSVVHRDRPELSHLSGATLGALSVAGRALGPVQPEVSADVDEVEFSHTWAATLRAVVRHTFAAGWGLRLALTSLAQEPQLLDRVELALVPGPGCLGWAVAHGVTGSYAVAPALAPAPLLGGVLRLGSFERVTATGVELGPIRLRPGDRYVVQLQWDWYRSTRAFGRHRSPETPSSLVLHTGETVQLQVTDDVAVVAPAGVSVSHADGLLELVAAHSDRFPVELRSARGTTHFTLEWVPPVEERLAELATAALAAPRSGAGVVKLTGVTEALLVQHALAAAALDDPEDAAEALDLFTARLRVAEVLSVVEAAYLCREHDRTGEGDLLDEAARAVLAEPRPVPGLGLAATQLCLGLMAGGRPVADVLAHLLALVDELPPADAALGVSERAAALELVTVTSAGPGASGLTPRPVDVSARIAALGWQLGGGLSGEPVQPLPVAELSHLVAVLQLLPDGLSAQQHRSWGCSAHALAAARVPGLLARLQTLPGGDSGSGSLSPEAAAAYAWLVLALHSS